MLSQQTLLLEPYPFANVHWWAQALFFKKINLIKGFPYRKELPLNRYVLSGSQGKQLMSIPIIGGRNQKTAVSEINISYEENWQFHHWKTMQTLYKRSPFFEFYAPEIEHLFIRETVKLLSWNKRSIETIQEILELDFQIIEIDFQEINSFIRKKAQNPPFIKYHQVFKDKVSFQENCSILDLLFCEGKNATSILRKQIIDSRIRL